MPLKPRDKPKRRKRRPALTLNILTRTPDGCVTLERRVTRGTIVLGLFDPSVTPNFLARAIQRKTPKPCR